MVSPDNFEQKTGFDRIRAMLSEKCISPLGRSTVERIRPSADAAEIEKQLRQTDEFRRILLNSEAFPNTGYHDLRPVLNRLLVAGTSIPAETLPQLLESLTTIVNCVVFLKKRADAYPLLSRLIALAAENDDILKAIKKIIDENGDIRDNASDSLSDIRKQLRNQQSRIDKTLNAILSQAKAAGHIPPEAELTIRNGRWVIPVPAGNKKRIGGIVHDESNTGQTLFIEPAQAFEETNFLIELRHAEKREIARILLRFSDFLRPHIPNLLSSFRFLALLDFIRAKALLAIQFNAIMPDLSPQPLIDWKDAAHPLLALSLQNQQKPLITNPVQLDHDQRILLISGPNAGGKSVYLKTAGLLQYMLQCGLLIPVREDSRAGIYSHICIILGDEQSLENDLSTYSSHLLQLNHLIEKAGPATLFLIDEFGSGTEPQAGGAIAQSILETLISKNAQGIVTTHYASLKLMAAAAPAMANAAMMFDTKRLMPLFKLRTGKPGSSFAFEIARSIGLQPDIISRATELAGKTQLDYDNELMQLDIEMETLRKRETGLKMADDFLNEVVGKYQKLHRELTEKRDTILAEARAKAALTLANANKLIENTIKQIREAEADKQQTRELRKTFEAEKESLLQPVSSPVSTLPASPPPATPQLSPPPVEAPRPIRSGDTVKVAGYDMAGEVLEIQNDDVIVVFENFSLRTRLEKIYRVSKETLTPVYSPASKLLMRSLPERMALFQSTLDVRGKRAAEAISLMQTYIDEAILLSVKEIRLLHGTGTGVLRNEMRKALRNIPEVIEFKDESHERGGSGITIVKLG